MSSLQTPTSLFLDACSQNKEQAMSFYMRDPSVEPYAYFLGLSLCLKSQDLTCFEKLSQFVIAQEKESQKQKQKQNDKKTFLGSTRSSVSQTGSNNSDENLFSQGLNAIIYALIVKNIRPQLKKYLTDPSIEKNLLDSCLFWSLEEFAENDQLPPSLVSPTPSSKILGLSYIIEYALQYKKDYPQTIRQINVFAESSWLCPLLDYVASQGNTQAQKHLTRLFKTKNAPPFIRSLRENVSVRSALKKVITQKPVSNKKKM